VVLLVVAGGICAVAQNEKSGTAADEQILAEITREIDLTDAQQLRIRTILSAERQTFEQLTSKLTQAHRQLRETSADGKFDEAQVRAIAAGKAQTMIELIVLKQRMRARIYNEVLTPNQRIQAAMLRHTEQPVAVVPLTDLPTIR
jgi:Spy/CpxP family protein refolding chaperone